MGAFGSYIDGFNLLNKAASKNKNIKVVYGANHYDLYDQHEATGECSDKLIPIFSGKPVSQIFVNLNETNR